jgi:hypothetical protein
LGGERIRRIAMSAVAYAGYAKEPKGLLRARCETREGAMDCRILDLNSNGAFIESFVPPVTGSTVCLNFMLPSGETVSASGVVKYHQFRLGFGLEFTELSGKDRDRIRSFTGN